MIIRDYADCVKKYCKEHACYECEYVKSCDGKIQLYCNSILHRNNVSIDEQCVDDVLACGLYLEMNMLL